MKKLLALVLALALALPLGVTAFAADAEKVDLSLDRALTRGYYVTAMESITARMT